MQHFGGKIARPAVFAIGGEARHECANTLIRGRDIGPAVQQRDKPGAHRGETVAAKPDADPPAHRRGEGGEIVELGLGQRADLALAEHFLEQRGLERKRADIALDAAGVLGALDQILEGPPQLGTG